MFPNKNPTAHSRGLSIALTQRPPCIIRLMNVLLSAITRFLRLVISGGSSQYDPEPGKVSTAALDGTNLDGAALTGSDLSGSDLTPGANLSGAYLDGAMLAYSNLTGATLTEAILDGVIGADLSDAFHVPAKYLKD